MRDSATWVVHQVSNGYAIVPGQEMRGTAPTLTNEDVMVFEDFNGVVAFLRSVIGPESGAEPEIVKAA